MPEPQHALIPHRPRLRLTPAGMVALPVGIVVAAGLSTWLGAALLGIRVWHPQGVVEGITLVLLAAAAALLWTALPVSVLTLRQVRQLASDRKGAQRGRGLEATLERYGHLQEDLEERLGQVREQAHQLAEGLARIEGQPDRQDLERGYRAQLARMERVDALLGQVLERVWTSRCLLALVEGVDHTARQRPRLPVQPLTPAQVERFADTFDAWLPLLRQTRDGLERTLPPRPASLVPGPLPRVVTVELGRLRQALDDAAQRAARLADELRFQHHREQTAQVAQRATRDLERVPEAGQVLEALAQWQQEEERQQMDLYAHLPLLEMDDLDPQVEALHGLGVHIEAEVQAALEVARVFDGAR